jgi:hypothetical protein
MTQAFFGPWRVLATKTEGPREGFEIAGSANADGFHELQDETTLELAVDGAEWTIEMMALFPFEAAEWFPYDAVRTTRYIQPQGLTTRLAITEEGVTLFFGPFVLTLVLQCVSMDPVINPPMSPNPFDFTLPEG